jgi:glutamate-ammonia-ligase adenylyltransferase
VEVLRQKRDESLLKNEILTMRKRMHDAHPNNSGLFDVKHDAGGMIDIEFIVQYLVLRHAASHPEIASDIGNIALLKLAGSSNLINVGLAEEVADAYRIFRKIQHQIRLKGEDRARVSIDKVSQHAEAVKKLWHLVLIGS